MMRESKDVILNPSRVILSKVKDLAVLPLEGRLREGVHEEIYDEILRSAARRMVTFLRMTAFWIPAFAGMASLICLSACISIGRPFPGDVVAKALDIGKTTQIDVEKTFGDPFRTGLQDGDLTWTYVNYKLRSFGDQCTQDLVVRFDARGIVKSYSYNTSSEAGCR